MLKQLPLISNMKRKRKIIVKLLKRDTKSATEICFKMKTMIKTSEREGGKSKRKGKKAHFSHLSQLLLFTIKEFIHEK